MKRIIFCLLCINMLALAAGCSQVKSLVTPARHEALADNPMLNDGEPPKNPITVNDLYPGSLPHVGKVETYTGPPPYFVYDNLLRSANRYYYPYYRNDYYRNCYPVRRTLVPRKYWY